MLNRILQRIGSAATRIRFNETKPIQINGRTCWSRRRLTGAAILVLMANSYARAVGLPMRMLTRQQWLEYESSAFTELLGSEPPLRQASQLLLPHVPGASLRDILADSSLEQKQAAVVLATRELARLHHQPIRHPLARCLQPFSHADATPGNVIVDLAKPRATWLDFETVHPASLSIPSRHADDLRTLLCGLATILPATELRVLTRTVLTTYDDPPTLNALRATFSFWKSHATHRLLAISTTETQWQSLLQALSNSTTLYS